MAFGRQNREAQQKRAKAPERVRQPLRAHPLFGTVLALWGAMLGFFVTMALPVDLVLDAAARIGMGKLGGMGRFALAGLAAMATGIVMLVLAGSISASRRNPKTTSSIAARAVRKVRTIDPVADLGSASLDAPVETMPFAPSEPRFRPEYEAEAEAEPAYERAAYAPLELDLAEFGALPGRNAVWVEEPAEDRADAELAVPAAQDPAPVFAVAPEPEAEPAPEPAPRPAPPPVAAMRRPGPRPLSPSAIERLRAVPTSELSMIQMVERFAAALHDHQSSPPGQMAQPIDLAGRDAALAEALKALAALSRDGAAESQSEPLRAALSRLQELRGAA